MGNDDSDALLLWDEDGEVDVFGFGDGDAGLLDLD
jgi:hypothetical protein